MCCLKFDQFKKNQIQTDEVWKITCAVGSTLRILENGKGWLEINLSKTAADVCIELDICG